MNSIYKYINDAINTPETPTSITFDDLKYKLAWNSDIKAYFNLHSGHRKLFLTEMYFLSYVYKKVKYVVYAGSAPGHHIFFLSTLFPALKFILVYLEETTNCCRLLQTIPLTPQEDAPVIED